MHVRKICLLKIEEIPCPSFCFYFLIHFFVIHKACNFFFQGKSNLGYLSHARVEWSACVYIARRLDPTDELYIFFDASYLLHYENQRQNDETICPPQDGDLDSQANKTLTV